MNILKFIICVAITSGIASCIQHKESAKSDSILGERLAIADEMDKLLREEIEIWYPKVIDAEDGGYLSDLDSIWEIRGMQNKMVVTQARHIWSCSKLATFYGDDRFIEWAAHGAKYLQEVMWDKEFGGFYTQVNKKGAVQMEGGANRIIKRLYGNAFAIYGLAAYYNGSGDSTALQLAIDGFNWLDKNSHDLEFGGYYQFMERDGTALMEGLSDPAKDQNSSIHLMEALAELYVVWPDPILRERLEEMIVIIRDTITTDLGYMRLFFKKDWTPITYKDTIKTVSVFSYRFNRDHVSFGHDIETAYLLKEASEILGLTNDEKTDLVGKRMTDHAMIKGWDETVGGIYERGYYFKDKSDIEIIEDSKNWWAQVEGMNTLLIMSDMYPNDERAYYNNFKKQWNYIKAFVMDSKNLGFYRDGIDNRPERINGPKSDIWKGNYHTARSMMNCISRLRSQSYKSI